MEKQSKIIKGLHAALDELELLIIEGENLDLDLIEGLQKRFEKLKEAAEQQSKK